MINKGAIENTYCNKMTNISVLESSKCIWKCCINKQNKSLFYEADTSKFRSEICLEFIICKQDYEDR